MKFEMIYHLSIIHYNYLKQKFLYNKSNLTLFVYYVHLKLNKVVFVLVDDHSGLIYSTFYINFPLFP